MEYGAIAALAAWGTMVGVDLVSFPQAMLNRPLVAATVAGAIAGDPEAGLRIGALLELFALDVLPIGAARYPDFGPGAVAAGALSAGIGGSPALGVAALLGLAMALIGGRSVDLMRRFNGRRIRRDEARLAAGDPAVIRRLHLLSLGADMVRSLLLTALGLALVRPVALLAGLAPDLERTLVLTAVAGGLVAALHGIVQRARAGGPRAWMAAGLAAGLALAWLV